MGSAKHALTPTQRARIDRLIALSAKRGIKVVLNKEKTMVTLISKGGEELGSRPVSDFAD